MLRESHDKLRPLLERRDHGFRWRGTDISRIEGLSDAVFGFAVTLLVVSLEPPKQFSELRHLLHGFVSFAICFGMLLLIWHAQYLYFRRYALDDKRTFLLNALLLLVVAFYVYPLRFLFAVLVNQFTGYQELDKAGVAIQAMTRADWQPLMLTYGLGFTAVYGIFTMLYLHAHRLRDALDLSPLERYETFGAVQENLVMVAIGVLSIILAALNGPVWSGMMFALIGPAQWALGMVHGRGRKRIASAPSAAVA